MTQREFFNAVTEGNVTDEVKEFAKVQVEKLNARNEARKNKETPAAKAKAEADETLRQRIIEVTEAGVNYTAKAIAEVLGDDVKFQKVASVIKPLVENGTFVKGETKIKGKGKVNCYTKQ